MAIHLKVMLLIFRDGWKRIFFWFILCLSLMSHYSGRVRDFPFIEFCIQDMVTLDICVKIN